MKTSAAARGMTGLAFATLGDALGLDREAPAATAFGPAAGSPPSRPLPDLLCAHTEIEPHADRAALQRILDPANCLGQSAVMVDRGLARMQG